MSNKDKKPFITIYKSISGWKSVLMEWDEEMETHLPWQTGYFAYATPEEAERDAQLWAGAEELKLII